MRVTNLFLTIMVLSTVSCRVSRMASIEPADREIGNMLSQVSADSIKSYVETLAAFGTRHALSDTLSESQGIGAARRWVAGKFNSFAQINQAKMMVELDAFEVAPRSRIPYTVAMKNVMATLTGSDPGDDRVLVVSGHLDSRASDVMDSVSLAPGANDDASGVAVVLELARIMSAYQFPCTIIFVAVQGEEQGLLGSGYLAKKLKDNSVNVIAMLNNDIVGNSLASETGLRNDNTVRVFSEMIPASESREEATARAQMRAENDSPSRQLARYIKEVTDTYLDGAFTVTLNARPDRFLRGGDHTPFNELGYTAVRFTEFHENFNRQHQNVRVENGVDYGDLPEHMDFPYAANVARVNLATLTSLAKAPGPPRQVSLKVNLGNTTVLNWEKPLVGSQVKGYNVLMRETYMPFWEEKFFTNDLQVVLPYSKDNYFFAVQAVGMDGNVSQMVMPIPVR